MLYVERMEKKVMVMLLKTKGKKVGHKKYNNINMYKSNNNT